MKHDDQMKKLKKAIKPEELRQEMVKSARVNLRVSEADKEKMTKMAKLCGMTLTEYLTRLHLIAFEKLGDDVPKKK